MNDMIFGTGASLVEPGSLKIEPQLAAGFAVMRGEDPSSHHL